ADVTAVAIAGMGDSLRADAVLSPGPVRWNDTLSAAIAGLNTDTPRFRGEARSSGGLVTQVSGRIPGWRTLEGTVRAEGRLPLGDVRGSLEEIRLRAALGGSVSRTFHEDL